MRINILFSVFLWSAFLAFAQFTSAQSPAHCEKLSFVLPSGERELFQLTFEDQFEGRRLDADKWTATEGVPRDPEGVFQLHYYKPQNIEVSDGTLKIWVLRDTMPQKDYKVWVTDRMVKFAEDFHFSSGEIVSTQGFGYGLYEIRCKLPYGKGMWPAFWIYGEPGGRYNEIDVFEYWNESGFLTPYSEKKLSRVQNMSAHFDGKMTKEKSTGPNVSEGFHTFTLIWDDCKMLWYRDGVLERSLFRYKGVRETDPDCSRGANRKNPKLNIFPIDENLRILAGVAVQSRDDAPDPDTEFPQSMEIDYIRYYEPVKSE